METNTKGETVQIISSQSVPSDPVQIKGFLGTLFPRSGQVAVVCAPHGNNDTFNLLCNHGSSHRALQPLSARSLSQKEGGGGYDLVGQQSYPNLLILDK